jgi:glycerol kinase
LKDTGGVYVVPAFVGLGAPYWKSEARGLITGITRGTETAHLVRACLEAIAYQTRDVFDLMQKALGQSQSLSISENLKLGQSKLPYWKRNEKFGRSIHELKVDGGACKNNFLMQFQADILGAKIFRPKVVELTARGAAHLAGVTMGLWKKSHDLKKQHQVDRIFAPSMKPGKRAQLYQGWLKAVERAML